MRLETDTKPLDIFLKGFSDSIHITTQEGVEGSFSLDNWRRLIVALGEAEATLIAEEAGGRGRRYSWVIKSTPAYEGSLVLCVRQRFLLFSMSFGVNLRARLPLQSVRELGTGLEELLRSNAPDYYFRSSTARKFLKTGTVSVTLTQGGVIIIAKGAAVDIQWAANFHATYSAESLEELIRALYEADLAVGTPSASARRVFLDYGWVVESIPAGRGDIGIAAARDIILLISDGEAALDLRLTREDASSLRRALLGVIV